MLLMGTTAELCSAEIKEIIKLLKNNKKLDCVSVIPVS